MSDADFIKRAIELSREAVAQGAYPVRAVVVQNGKIVGEGISDGKRLFDPTSHAEVAAIRVACQTLKKRDIDDVVLYSSLEPCVMCFSASFWAHIPRVVYVRRRKRVDPRCYEGDHDIHALNKKSHRSIELFHIKELEAEALEVINDWESR